MAEQNVTVTVSTKVRWWVAPYCTALNFVALVTGTEPDWAKLEALIVRRGVSVTIKTR